MIHDVETKDLQINADSRGSLTEIWRSDWSFYDEDDEPEMSYVSMSYPGIVRAWHRHRRGQIDHFVVPKGKVKVVAYDDREESPTRGEVDERIIGEGNMVAVRVPGDCWHGFEVVGDQRAFLVNFPTELYDYENPDEERLPYDSDRIPYEWTPPHE